MEAPATKTIGLFVLGADAKTVSISVDEPPSFVTLKGALLQLSPTIKDAGDYVVTLKAVADHQTATGTLRLHVTRTNTPPFALPQPRIVQTAAGSEAEAVVCDNEGDDIIFRIEVTPVGQQLTGTATHSMTVSFETTAPLTYEPYPCAEFRIPLDGFASGDYQAARYIADSLGAASPYGWVSFGAPFHLPYSPTPAPAPCDIAKLTAAPDSPGTTPPGWGTDAPSEALKSLAQEMVGAWTGIRTTPWDGTLPVTLAFFSNGSYSAGVSSIDELPFYYGSRCIDHSPYWLLSEGTAEGGTGELGLAWDYGLSSVEELQKIQISSGHLTFELWHGHQYGPSRFDLTRMP